jgi:hypothetical protein
MRLYKRIVNKTVHMNPSYIMLLYCVLFDASICHYIMECSWLTVFTIWDYGNNHNHMQVYAGQDEE